MGRDNRSHSKLNLKDFVTESDELKTETCSIKSFCGNCFQYTGKGLPHPCTRKAAVDNISELVLSKDKKLGEQVTSKLLKKLADAKGDSNISLSTGE